VPRKKSEKLSIVNRLRKLRRIRKRRAALMDAKKCALISLLLAEQSFVPRRAWMLPRGRRWFRDEVMTVWEDDRWLENFRGSGGAWSGVEWSGGHGVLSGWHRRAEMVARDAEWWHGMRRSEECGA